VKGARSIQGRGRGMGSGIKEREGGGEEVCKYVVFVGKLSGGGLKAGVELKMLDWGGSAQNVLYFITIDLSTPPSQSPPLTPTHQQKKKDVQSKNPPNPPFENNSNSPSHLRPLRRRKVDPPQPPPQQSPPKFRLLRIS